MSVQEQVKVLKVSALGPCMSNLSCAIKSSAAHGAAGAPGAQAAVDTIKANPAVLNTPDLKFMKDFIEGFGGKVPDAKPPGTPSGGGHGHGHGNAVRFGLRFRRTSEPRLTRGFGCAEGVRRRARLLRRGRQLLPRPRQGRGRPRPRPRARRRRQGGGC